MVEIFCIKLGSIFYLGGTGIGIAVIDNPLLVDHTEIKDNLKFYQSYSDENQIARIHGVATAKE